MKMHSSPRRATRAAFCCGLLTAFASAQTVPPPATPASPVSDEVVTLPEFNVTSASNGSYTPEGSTAGSRIATAYKDLPYNVNVLTADFLKDFSVFTLNDELQFNSSLTGADDAGNFNLRGYSGNINLRNGFSSLGVMDISSLDRIETIMGAAAAVYGQTNPGGLIYVTTVRPPRNYRENLTQTIGSYDTTQTRFKVGGPIPDRSGEPKVFFIVTGNYYHRKYRAPEDESTFTKGVYASLIIKPDDRTDIVADANYNLIHNNANTALPFAVNPANTAQFIGFAWPIVDKSFASPVDHADRTVFSYDLTIEHRFNDHVSFKIGGNIYRSPRWTYNSFGGGNYNPGTGTIVGRSATISNGLILGDGRSYIAEVPVHYDLGPVKALTLVTVDDYANMRKDPSWSTVARPIAATFDPNNPVYAAYVPWSWDSVGNAAAPRVWSETRNDSNIVETTGGQFAQMFTLGRLILGGSVRHDYSYSDQRNIIGQVNGGNPNVETKFHSDANTYQLGVTYKVTDGISLFGGRYGGFVPPSTTINAGTVAPNQTSTDVEGGVKADLLNHRLTVSFDDYHVERKNESVTVPIDPTNPNSATTTSFIGNSKTNGFEFNADYLFGAGWQTRTSYAYTDNRVLNAGRDKLAVGMAAQGIARHSLSQVVRWQANDALSFGASLRYLGSAHIAAPTAGGIVTAGTITTDNGQRELYSPAYALLGGFAAYRWRMHGVTHTLQLSVKNALDRRYLVINSRNVGDGASVFLTFSVDH